MRVFVSEYLSGGAFAGKIASASMCREGLAMLRAVVEDIGQLPGCSVVTTLQHDLSASLVADVLRIENADHERGVFQSLLREVDAVLVIAPETNGVLAARCRMVRASGTASWNCSPEAIELCSDKFQLARHLERHHLATIPTQRANLRAMPNPFSSPVVLKPRDGAGSQLTFLVRNREDWFQAINEIEACGEASDFVLQPFVSGRKLSIGVNIGFDGKRIQCLEIGEQRLSDDGRFQYCGGVIPAAGIAASAKKSLQRLVVGACQSIPGLAGYIGFDLILTEQDVPIIVEINTRLTTSYIGYRRLTKASLPAQWLGEARHSMTALPPEKSDQIPQRIEFDVTSLDWL